MVHQGVPKVSPRRPQRLPKVSPKPPKASQGVPDGLPRRPRRLPKASPRPPKPIRENRALADAKRWFFKFGAAHMPVWTYYVLRRATGVLSLLHYRKQWCVWMDCSQYNIAQKRRQTFFLRYCQAPPISFNPTSRLHRFFGIWSEAIIEHT